MNAKSTGRGGLGELLAEFQTRSGWMRVGAVVSSIRYLKGALARRWHPRSDTILVLDMPLTPRSVDPSLVYERIVSPDRLSDFASLRETVENWHRGTYVAEVAERLRRGDWCFVAIVDRRVASALFVSTGPCHIAPVSYTLTLPWRTVGFYDVYTTPEFRRRSVYSQLFNAAVNASIKEGYEQAWLWVMRENIASVNVHRRLGMDHVNLVITHSQRWGFKWHRFRHVSASIDDLSSNTQERLLGRTSAI